MFRNRPFSGLRAVASRRPRALFPRLDHSSFRFISTSKNATPVTFGILRETYNTWERRVPIVPRHVKSLLGLNDDEQNIRVIIQPCDKRVFGRKEYEEAGAIIQEDLRQADIILGVKRPIDVTTLLPQKTYMFFSHVIKGQPANMGLLRECLEKKIQLLDYEKILRPDGKRLVAFGRFAGLAGAIDALHGLGRRLHQEGTWTPFSAFPPTIYKDGLEDAKENVRKLAETIASGGMPADCEPLVIVVTGKGGAVHQGVMEILQILPHKIIVTKDLPPLFSGDSPSKNQIYIAPLGTSDLFERDDGSFDRLDFAKNPREYRSVFKDEIAPYAHVVINCAYWDHRFPRIMTKADAKDLFKSGSDRFRLLSDISCDVNGSFEFLEKTTCIAKPFFQYNPLTDKVNDDVSATGITVNGVDILPTQLPKESSEHFGDKLFPVVQELASCFVNDGSKRGVEVNKLSNGIRNACITSTSGSLEEGYRYLEQFYKKQDTQSHGMQKHTMVLRLLGHLFDSGLINLIADAVERNHCNLAIEGSTFPCGPSETTMSSLTLRITTNQGATVLDDVENDIRSQMEKCAAAEATMSREEVDQPRQVTVSVEKMNLPKILVLGSGYVAKAAVKFLDLQTASAIQVASNKESEARQVASVARRSSFVTVDIFSERKRLSELVQGAEIVLSLVPATMHVAVAEECLQHGKHLVTCSYVNKEMQALSGHAERKGLVFLNEVGLDPGLDHMSAMRIIDDIKKRGGAVTRFVSVCGGLPSPDCLDATNKLHYKFSWSPSGVLRASKLDACYRENGKIISVSGKDLLGAAVPFKESAWPEMDLDVIPNRNSLAYASIYGLEKAHTIFRGTLRYRGFAPLMRFFLNLGLMSSDTVTKDSWGLVLSELAAKNNFQDLQEFYLYCASGDANLAREALIFMNHLEITGSQRPGGVSLDEAFCKALEQKLSYLPGESDMVLMHHNIGAILEDGTEENHTSTLKLFGDGEVSAMAKTVGFTAGAAVMLVLERGLESNGGVLLPTIPSIYQPILEKVEGSGIHFVEEVYSRPAGVFGT